MAKKAVGSITFRPVPPGWHLRHMPNVPNPWLEVLPLRKHPSGMTTQERMAAWCRDTLTHPWECHGFDRWVFENLEDAVLFELTWA